MKKKKFNVERLKFNAYLLAIILIIIFMYIYLNIDSETISYSENQKQVENIMNQEPIDFNQKFDNHLYYTPAHYVITDKSDNTVNFEESNAYFTLYFGNDMNGTISSDTVNTDLVPIDEEYTTQWDTNDGIAFFYVWEYDETPDTGEDYIQVMLGKDNSYIAGIFKEENKDEYITDMTYIFNSIRTIDEEE